MARRRYTPKLKAQVVLRVLAGDKTSVMRRSSGLVFAGPCHECQGLNQQSITASPAPTTPPPAATPLRSPSKDRCAGKVLEHPELGSIAIVTRPATGHESGYGRCIC